MGSPSIIKSPLFNAAFLLVSMQLTKRIDWDDPTVLLMARISYFSAQALVIGMAYMLIAKIKKTNDRTPLRYIPANKPGSGQAFTTTYMDYDIAQLMQFIQSTAMSILMISGMHFYFKFTQPLVLQSVLPVKNLLTHKVALIHLWGDAPEGDLKRPFKTENPLAALLGGGNEATPAEGPTEATSTQTAPTAEPADGHAKTE